MLFINFGGWCAQPNIRLDKMIVKSKKKNKELSENVIFLTVGSACVYNGVYVLYENIISRWLFVY